MDVDYIIPFCEPYYSTITNNKGISKGNFSVKLSGCSLPNCPVSLALKNGQYVPYGMTEHYLKEHR